MISVLKSQFPIALLITLVLGISYIGSQQILRQSANDPQIELSEEVANKLLAGTQAGQIIGGVPVDMAKSLSVFAMVFDKDNKIVVSNGQLNLKNPTVPAGVFASAAKNGQSRFTWQPQKDVRLAAVVTHFSGQYSGYVLVAKSLREVEKRESSLGWEYLVGWLATEVLFLTSAAFVQHR